MALRAKNDYTRGIYEQQIEQTGLELDRVRGGKIESLIDPFVPYRTALGKARGLLKSPYSVWKKMEVEEQHGLFFFVFEQKLAYDPKIGYRTANLPAVATL